MTSFARVRARSIDPLSTTMVLRATLEKKEEKERVRVALLRAALHLAAEHGFASLGLREVSREAGIAPTSFYRHFADMEELGATLIRERVGGIRRELSAGVLAAAPADAISVLVDATHAVAKRDPELMRFIVAERAGAFAGHRELLRQELAALAQALFAAYSGLEQAPSGPPPMAAEAAIALLFDAAGRSLDEPANSSAAAREPLIACLRALLTAAAPRGSDG